MEEVWQKTFKNKEVKFPNEIAVEYCNQLYSLTNNLVIAKVEKYNKSLDDMNEIAPIMTIANASTSMLLREGKAEQYLGEVSGKDKFTYEMYLTGIKTPKYKYRFCFIENGVYPYPTMLVIDTDIANELKIQTRIKCDDETTFKGVLLKILNSKKMYEVIEGLMTINSKAE